MRAKLARDLVEARRQGERELAATAAEQLSREAETKRKREEQAAAAAALQAAIAAEHNAARKRELQEQQRRQRAALTVTGAVRVAGCRRRARAMRAERALARRNLAAARITHFVRGIRDCKRARVACEKKAWERQKKRAEQEARQRAAKEREAELKRREEALALKREQDEAALKLQQAMRVKMAKEQVEALRKQAEEEEQRFKQLERLRKEEATREGAALRIQCAFRTRKARKQLQRRLKQHNDRLDKMRAEGASRDKLRKLQEEQEREIAATKVQNLYRAKVARLQLEQRKAQHKKETARQRRVKEERRRYNAAAKIQAVFRGFRDRAVLRRKAKAAKNAKAKKQAKKEQQQPKAAKSAPPDPFVDWIEYRDEASGYPYWFNTATQEARWTDPRTDAQGYQTAGDVTDYDTDNAEANYADYSAYSYAAGYGYPAAQQPAQPAQPQEQGYYDQNGAWRTGYYDQYGQWVDTTPAAQPAQPDPNQIYAEYYDDTYQCSFYYNSQTYQAEWAPPPGFVSRYANPFKDAPRYAAAGATAY